MPFSKKTELIEFISRRGPTSAFRRTTKGSYPLTSKPITTFCRVGFKATPIIISAGFINDSRIPFPIEERL
jgi:hypothetical protein